VRRCDNPPDGFAVGRLLQDDVAARLRLMILARAENESESGAHTPWIGTGRKPGLGFSAPGRRWNRVAGSTEI